jgi:hypothetical protein
VVGLGRIGGTPWARKWPSGADCARTTPARFSYLKRKKSGLPAFSTPPRPLSERETFSALPPFHGGRCILASSRSRYVSLLFTSSFSQLLRNVLALPADRVQSVRIKTITKLSLRLCFRFNCIAGSASFAERRAIYKTGCRCFGGFIFIDLPSFVAHSESNPMPASVKSRFGIPQRQRPK